MLERKTEAGSIPETLPDGVYFNLPAEDYHRDPALGSGDISLLLKHPGDYWWASWMNPQQPPAEPTAPQQWGSAFHALIVEGEEAFDARYYRGPSQDDYPGVLVLADDLRKWLKLHGYAVSGNKSTLENRVLSADPVAPVWSEIERKAEVLAEGRTILDPRVFDKIVLASAYVTKHPKLARAFTNGYPEVSVFWTLGETYVESFGNWPVRCKARIDYLKFRGLVDLKSIRMRQKMKEFDVAINDAISWYGYDVQAAHYCQAREQIPEFIRTFKTFGEVESSWLKRYLELSAEPFIFSWVFYQADGAPLARRIDYNPKADYHFHAVADIERALERYRRYLSVFGVSQWVDVTEPRTLTSEDLRTRLAAIV